MTGILSPGLQIFCPLNQDIMLLLIDTNLYNLKRNSYSTIYLNQDSDVDSINKLQFLNCLHNVFFSDENDESYVRNLHYEVKELIKEKEAKSKTVQTTQNRDGSYSEIVEMYTTDNNYALSVSFIKLNHKNNRHFKIKYKKLSKSSKVFKLCRNVEIANRLASRCEKEFMKAKTMVNK